MQKIVFLIFVALTALGLAAHSWSKVKLFLVTKTIAGGKTLDLEGIKVSYANKPTSQQHEIKVRFTGLFKNDLPMQWTDHPDFDRLEFVEKVLDEDVLVIVLDNWDAIKDRKDLLKVCGDKCMAGSEYWVSRVFQSWNGKYRRKINWSVYGPEFSTN